MQKDGGTPSHKKPPTTKQITNMRHEIHGITKTVVEFLPNEVQARIILLQGDAYIVSFPSMNNFQSGGHFVKLLSAMFDLYAPTANKVTTENIKRINAELYLSDYEMISNIYPDQDKHEERKRIGQQIIELRKLYKIDGKTLAARVGTSPSNLSRIEQGHFSVGFDMLNKIANALGTRVELVKCLDIPAPTQKKSDEPYNVQTNLNG